MTLIVPAQGNLSVVKALYQPACYELHLNCTDIDGLPECKPRTRYQTETVC